MFTISERNAHRTLVRGATLITRYGVERDSRNGKVLQMPQPTTFHYQNPVEKIVWFKERDANPFFHFMEALWMLGGRNDVDFVSRYVKTMGQFSDDGVTFNGAYGFRWRVHFGRDQLHDIVENLRRNQEDRRNVLTMWDGGHDLGLQSKDVPCNTQAYFQINPEGSLDMTVCNRSNDMVWGALGANCVHFAMLQEFMAAAVGVPVGGYWQMSANMHVYERHFELITKLNDVTVNNQDRYDLPLEHFPLMSIAPETWMQDLAIFLDEGPIVGFRDPFFRRVATPIYQAFQAYQNKNDPRRIDAALQILDQCKDPAWAMACSEWLERRRK